MTFQIRRNEEGHMLYIDAWELVECCLTNGILKMIEKDGERLIPIYREASPENPEQYPEGYYLYTKEAAILMIINDEEGVKFLVNALQEKGITFVPSFNVDLLQDFKDIPINEEELNYE